MSSPRRLSAWKIAGLTVFTLFLLLVGTAWSIGAIGGNWRTVEPGKVYRSGQLTGARLRWELRTHRIKTVINLRGYSPTEDWYREETATCRKLGIGHKDVELWASRLPEPEELNKLLAAYDGAVYPVLIHCQGGADRSGLAAALYRIIHEQEPVSAAVSRNLTWRYAHFRSKALEMDRFFELYEQSADGQDMKSWIAKTYPKVYQSKNRGQ